MKRTSHVHCSYIRHSFNQKNLYQGFWCKKFETLSKFAFFHTSNKHFVKLSLSRVLVQEKVQPYSLVEENYEISKSLLLGNMGFELFTHSSGCSET